MNEAKKEEEISTESKMIIFKNKTILITLSKIKCICQIGNNDKDIEFVELGPEATALNLKE